MPKIAVAIAIASLVVTLGPVAATAGETTLATSCRPVVTSPGFVLPDGERTALSTLAQGRPVAVIVIKGSWCSACRDQLLSLSEMLDEIREAGGDVVGLSTEDAGTNRMIMKDLGLGFPILGEPSARLLERLGMWIRDKGHPMPGVIFLDACGDVAARQLGRRPGVSQDAMILETLRKLAQDGSRCGTES